MKKFDKRTNQIVLPALRGRIGDWVFYSCLMSMREMGKRVKYAKELWESNKLSEMIQRSLMGGRATNIATYIKNNQQRFFNSIIVGTYDGEPQWYSFSNADENIDPLTLEKINERMDSIGFLKLAGSENLFAVDGQHRLAGIRNILNEEIENGKLSKELDDDISVIFISHKMTKKGVSRTRRLFTVLNKSARPVSKKDIIALDEDDVAAATTRWLIEEAGIFSDKNLSFDIGNNINSTDYKSLTTIGNLYACMNLLFDESKSKKKTLPKKQNLSSEELEIFFRRAEDYFKLLIKYFPSIKDFFSDEDNPSIIVRKYRGGLHDHILFRPIGLELFTEIIMRLQRKHSTLEKSISLLSLLPTDLSKEPYLGLLWRPSKERDRRGGVMMGRRHRVTVREVLMHLLGEQTNYSDIELENRYFNAITTESGSDGNPALPAKIRIDTLDTLD